MRTLTSGCAANQNTLAEHVLPTSSASPSESYEMEGDLNEAAPFLEQAPRSGRIGAKMGFIDSAQRSKMDLFVLTFPFFGLQLAWTIQQVFGIPYLLSLGVPETQLPLFVLSGPLAGFLGPPAIALLSNACQTPWGKRKAFIFLGGISTILSFLVLSSAPRLAAIAVCLFHPTDPHAEQTVSQVIAGLGIYSLNFSIQPLQLGLRASVIDHFSPHQQPAANLWIGRFSSLGSVFVSLLGLCYSPGFQNLSIAVTIILALMLVFVAMTNSTNLPSYEIYPDHEKTNSRPFTLKSHVREILSKARNLPPLTHRSCKIQLVSWFAWFLVLMYTSPLISSIYANNEHVQTKTQLPLSQRLQQMDSDTAISLVALLFHSSALTTLLVVALLFRQPPNSARDYEQLPQVDGTTHNHFATLTLRNVRILLMNKIWKPSLGALAASLLSICSITKWASPSSSTSTTISILLGINGALFALSNWVPYALIAHEASTHARTQALASTGVCGYGEDDTPIILAVHNMAITVPQIAASLSSWLLMQGLAFAGVEQTTLWVFVMCIPVAVLATMM